MCLILNYRISASIIGKDWFTSKYESEPIEKVTVTSDKEAYQSAKPAVGKKEFVWVVLDKYRRVMSDPDTPTDQRIKVRTLYNPWTAAVVLKQPDSNQGLSI